MRDERQILTREHIYNKLIREAKRSMLGSIMMLVLGSLILGIMSFVFLGAANDNNFTALTILEMILSAAFVLTCGFFFVRALWRLFKAKHGEFTVFEDTLTEIEDNKFSLWQLFLSGNLFSQANYNHIFKFKSGKKFIANSSEFQNTHIDTAAQISLIGDHFILVYYNDVPEKVIWIYSNKIYNYKS